MLPKIAASPVGAVLARDKGDAVYLINRSVYIAGKHRSHRHSVSIQAVDQTVLSTRASRSIESRLRSMLSHSAVI